MGFKFKREGNQCERCKKDISQVGKMEFYEEYDLWCCDNCIKETVKEKNQECSVCKKPVGVQHLSLFNGKQMCYPCVKKQDKKDKTREQRKSFLKRNTKFLIIVGLMIIGLVIAYVGLTPSN